MIFWVVVESHGEDEEVLLGPTSVLRAAEAYADHLIDQDRTVWVRKATEEEMQAFNTTILYTVDEETGTPLFVRRTVQAQAYKWMRRYSDRYFGRIHATWLGRPDYAEVIATWST